MTDVADIARRALRRMNQEDRIEAAREDFLAFCELMMPDPRHYDDLTKTKYVVKPFHRIQCEALMALERGEIQNLITNAPPRHGKTQTTSKLYPAWRVGRNPDINIIVGTYSDSFAKTFGDAVRTIINSERYRMVFPEVALKSGSKAADRLAIDGRDGLLYFVGRGGGTTGKGADLFLVDDPVKDAKEASSIAIRNQIWEWYQRVVETRLMTDTSQKVIIVTRWSEDDLVGRIIDPNNPYYDREYAREWHKLVLKALAESDDPLKRKVDEPLWPERFGYKKLDSIRRRDPYTFAALYQNEPSPPDGNYFKRDDLVTYKPEDLPKNLRLYAASDHAVGTEERHDLTCFMIFGLDYYRNIWILPDMLWERIDTAEATARIIELLKKHQPLFWWAEKSQITQSIGPFLRTAMQEEGVYTGLIEQHSSKDKVTRAQPIMARIRQKRVRFPAAAPWWGKAMRELLAFPNGTHDDFVDALSEAGRGLEYLTPAQQPKRAPKVDEFDDEVIPGAPPVGTFAWIKWAAKQEKDRARAMMGI